MQKWLKNCRFAVLSCWIHFQLGILVWLPSRSEHLLLSWVVHRDVHHLCEIGWRYGTNMYDLGVGPSSVS